ncbi:MAG: carboxylesterase/lipase family protein [Bacteroidales bacterium]|nr:carboxylesterase/lipase family protein [Bacteroidales bacterium]MBQ9175187.1 carboxylesterase/lipase family protein [Bacteroidales bacterium]
MKLSALFSVAALAAVLSSCGSNPNGGEYQPGPITAGEHTRVNTTYGTVEGYLDDDVYTFKGIKYAKADRFMPPQYPDKFEGVRMCKLYGPKAMQNQDLVWRDNTQRDYNFGNQFIYEAMSEEDCLVLNVWTKGLADGKKRPVFIWIHGGGYATGSGHDLACYEGRSLADKGDIVTVNINHRLNVLGYADLSGLGGQYSKSVNLGMQDIVKALEWVRDNIEKFGGDPSCVTIGGQSGGGGKVSTLMAMPSAKGLFHRAVVQSGSTLRIGLQESSRKLGLAFLEELGVTAQNAAEKLSTFTYQELVDAGNRASAKLRTGGFGGGFGPVLDGDIVAVQPFDPVASEISADVPMLIGTNFNEFMFDISEPKTEAQVMESLSGRLGEEKAAGFIEEFKKVYPGEDPKAMLYIDTRSRVGAINQAAAKSRQGTAPAYLYLFLWKPENNVLGASHGMELPFMFNNVAVQREMTGSSESAYRLQEIVSNYWISFIKTGDPNVKGQPQWQPYDSEQGACMILDNECELRFNHDKSLLELAQ